MSSIIAPTTSILEYVASDSGTSVDEARGIIRGVVVLGEQSANGRDYPMATRQAALPLYEGAKVYLDHPVKPGDPRPTASSFGWLEGLQNGGFKLRGDLRYNPEHSRAKEIIWWARHRPTQLGLSHNCEGVTKPGRNGRKIVESITRVHSVDLVSDPATTKGFFESTSSGRSLAGIGAPTAFLTEAAQFIRQAYCGRERQKALKRFLSNESPAAYQRMRLFEALAVDDAPNADIQPPEEIDTLGEAAAAVARIIDLLASGQRPQDFHIQSLRAALKVLEDLVAKNDPETASEARVLSRAAQMLLEGRTVSVGDVMTNKLRRRFLSSRAGW